MSWKCKKCKCKDFYVINEIKYDREGNMQRVNETFYCSNCDNYGDEIQDIAEFDDAMMEDF